MLTIEQVAPGLFLRGAGANTEPRRARIPRAKFPLRLSACTILAVMCCTLMVPQSARAETPAAYMQRVANELIAASRSGGGSATAFASAIRSNADVPSIGLTALGDYASSLPKSQRPTYFNGMVNWIARYAAKEAPKYSVAKAVMTSQSVEGGFTYVDSRVTLRDGTSYDVRWRLVRRGSVYKVSDAEISGIPLGMGSAGFALQSMFQKFIGENGGDPKSLVMALNR